jgi:hypothetical protein
MKTLTRLSCLIITAAVLLYSRNTAYAVGATLPFTSYEAEAGTLGGGASIVALTSPPTTRYSSPQLEASGHAYVKLTGTGQYVEWTNNTGQNITAINLRSCIPDAPGGGGITSTIDLYVNGVFRQAFNVNSQQNYCYEGTNYNDQTDKNPADGDPRDFWNDTHAFVTGAAIAPGSTFRFEKDSANSAAFYYVDVVDVENPPAALSQPANSLSITSYGAQANNSSFDNTSAINNCFSAAKAQGKIAWIPAGTFYFSAIHGGLNADGITIDGAGPWYTTLYRVTPANNNIGIANIITATSSTLQNMHLDCNGNSRANTNNDGAVDFSGSNWLVNNVWIEHVTSSFWCAGDHGEAENCRTDSNWSDGGNFNNVQDSRGIGEFLTYTNNFVRGEGDDAMAINSVHDNGGTILATMSNITYSNNTVMAMWGGKGMGIYGGSNVLVTNNLISDSARYIGLGVGRFGVDGSDLTSGTVTGNVLIGCGGNGYDQEQPALQIGNGGDGQSTGLVEDVTVSGNTVIDSLYNGVGFSTCTNINFNNNIVNSPGLNGIVISPAFFPAPTGSASITDNTVTGVASGETAYANESSGFTATLSGNTWQGGPGAEAPYGGTAASIPGTVQAENYDIGGQGAAYNVTSINGTDNGYRVDGVDLEVTSDTGGGVDLGWTAGGQWFKYTVNVATAGTYTVSFRVAAPTAVTDAFHLSNSSGTDLSGFVNIPATGGYQTWTTVTANVTLPAGQQVLTLNQDNGGWNINDMSFATSGGGTMTEQCSTLAESNTAGLTYSQITGGPNGEIACKLYSTAVGQFLQFTVTGIVQGTSYDVTIGYRSDPTRGQCTLSINGNAQPQMATLDEYQATTNWNQTADLGTFTAGAAGTTRTFTFTVSGKNSAATGYTMAPEWIALTPL